MTRHAGLAALLAASARDAAVRARIAAWCAAKELVDADDQLHAARVLLASDVAAEVEAAQTLALAAMAKLSAARPLAATAFDRLRMLAGKPQKFGTQWVVRDGGVGELWPVDGSTTDSERAKWGLPGLAELRVRGGARD
jgi:hypothetical protein